jgi:hypothetical protein
MEKIRKQQKRNRDIYGYDVGSSSSGSVSGIKIQFEDVFNEIGSSSTNYGVGNGGVSVCNKTFGNPSCGKNPRATSAR